MKNRLEFLKYIHGLLKNPLAESLKLSMRDVHHKGLFSLVIGGVDFGNLTRVFIADEAIKPYEVQLHSHRYPIRLTAVKGIITHYVAHKSIPAHGTVCLSEFEYKSPLNGGQGLKYISDRNVLLAENIIPVGSQLEMTADDIHTVSCEKGAIWIVEEMGFKYDSSRVLGVPFVVDDLYNPAEGFQINDKVQLVAKEIKRIILDYELV